MTESRDLARADRWVNPDESHLTAAERVTRGHVEAPAGHFKQLATQWTDEGAIS